MELRVSPEKSFGDDSRNMTLGVRREPRKNDNPGPGNYEPERADSQTKHRKYEAIIMGKRDD